MRPYPVVLILLTLPVPLAAEPFVPAADSVVLERLPASASADPELRRLRAELAADPENLPLALELAWRYVGIARAEGDPRWNGYAQAVVAPWWDDARPPATVLLLRATLEQHRHDFASALRDLERLLAAEPRNARAWLLRAVILQVRGDFEGAWTSCLAVRRLSRSLLGPACLASVGGVTGRGAASYELLRRALAASAAASAEERIWAATELARIAERLGRAELAERHYREALELGEPGVYLLAAYADFLLDHGRPRDVVKLLDGAPRAGALLLRRALAARRLGEPDLEDRVRELEARFAASRRRGEETHLGLEARFTLDLLERPAEALELALRNWQVQKEPIDARVVLDAARAAGRPAAARPVEEWLEATGLEDVRLSH